MLEKIQDFIDYDLKNTTPPVVKYTTKGGKPVSVFTGIAIDKKTGEEKTVLSVSLCCWHARYMMWDRLPYWFIAPEGKTIQEIVDQIDDEELDSFMDEKTKEYYSKGEKR